MLGFARDQRRVQEQGGMVELTIAIQSGRGTEIPFDIEYFTTDGSAKGKLDITKLGRSNSQQFYGQLCQCIGM